MTAIEGTWSEIELAGHACDVFQPAQCNDRGFAVIYLHGVRMTRLADNAVFTHKFARHGLPVIAPMTGPCWWTDRICPEFDPHLTPERHVLENVLPLVKSRWNAAAASRAARHKHGRPGCAKNGVQAPDAVSDRGSDLAGD